MNLCQRKPLDVRRPEQIALVCLAALLAGPHAVREAEAAVDDAARTGPAARLELPDAEHVDARPLGLQRIVLGDLGHMREEIVNREGVLHDVAPRAAGDHVAHLVLPRGVYPVYTVHLNGVLRNDLGRQSGPVLLLVSRHLGPVSGVHPSAVVTRLVDNALPVFPTQRRVSSPPRRVAMLGVFPVDGHRVVGSGRQAPTPSGLAAQTPTTLSTVQAVAPDLDCTSAGTLAEPQPSSVALTLGGFDVSDYVELPERASEVFSIETISHVSKGSAPADTHRRVGIGRTRPPGQHAHRGTRNVVSCSSASYGLETFTSPAPLRSSNPPDAAEVLVQHLGLLDVRDEAIAVSGEHTRHTLALANGSANPKPVQSCANSFTGYWRGPRIPALKHGGLKPLQTTPFL